MAQQGPDQRYVVHLDPEQGYSFMSVTNWQQEAARLWPHAPAAVEQMAKQLLDNASCSEGECATLAAAVTGQVPEYRTTAQGILQTHWLQNRTAQDRCTSQNNAAVAAAAAAQQARPPAAGRAAGSRQRKRKAAAEPAAGEVEGGATKRARKSSSSAGQGRKAAGAAGADGAVDTQRPPLQPIQVASARCAARGINRQQQQQQQQPDNTPAGVAAVAAASGAPPPAVCPNGAAPSAVPQAAAAGGSAATPASRAAAAAAGEEEEEEGLQEEEALEAPAAARISTGTCRRCNYPRKRANEAKCANCGVEHKVAKDEELTERYRAMGAWNDNARPVEKMKYAAMEAHVRSGTKHTAHTLAITYRQNMKGNKLTFEAYGAAAESWKGSKALRKLLEKYVDKFEKEQKGEDAGSLGAAEQAELTALLEPVGMQKYLKGLLKQKATVELLAGQLSGEELAGVASSADVPMGDLVTIVRAAKAAKAHADGGPPNASDDIANSGDAAGTEGDEVDAAAGVGSGM